MEQKNENMVMTKTNHYAIPMAIVVAGVLIAGAIFYSSGNKSKPDGNGNTVNLAAQQAVQPRSEGDGENDLKPITDQDHIFGNPNAPVKIVEFSDLECPFCKRFHLTMKQIIDEYGRNGRVAWVYRHFPLDQLHPKARKEAEATECANELGGNSKFWAYLDRLFEITPSNNQLNPNQLPEIAVDVGLDQTKFSECLESGKYAQHVADDLADAQNSGGQGTPWSVVVTQNGKKFPLSGAQPYSAVKTLIETALQEK